MCGEGTESATTLPDQAPLDDQADVVESESAGLWRRVSYALFGLYFLVILLTFLDYGIRLNRQLMNSMVVLLIQLTLVVIQMIAQLMVIRFVIHRLLVMRHGAVTQVKIHVLKYLLEIILESMLLINMKTG